jgi:hypothetical protein
MSRPSVLILVVAAFGAAAIATAFAAVNRARSQRAPAVARKPAVPAVPRLAPTTTAVGAVTAPAAPPPKPVSYGIADIKPGDSISLRYKPGGRILAHVGSTTEFGSRTTLSVAATRGDWLGVTSTALPNGKVGWVRASRTLDMHRTQISIRVDLSKRTLELRKGKSTVRHFQVAIGRPGSPTPTGRYAITDKLAGSQYGPYYGCCILALSGHQMHTPAGWHGGNRLAIHGTDAPGTIGTPASAGCLRAADADLRVLMRRVPVGTPVFIKS